VSGVRLPHDWFPAPLPPNVEIGEGSWLHSSYAFLHYRSRRPLGVRIGRDTGVYAGSFFDLGPGGEVWIGDFATVVGAIIRTDARVEVHDYAFVAHEVVIADSFAAVPPDAALPGAPPRDPPRHRPGVPADPPLSVVLGPTSWVGARAILLAGARIGEGSIVGAGAVVDFEVPPFTVVAGNPAHVVRRLRAGAGPEGPAPAPPP
jgi:acetyltransferase-like isoleucine patch superfamily enzyme